jgi:NAD(P)H dehydrogenase (quinone)
VAFTCHDGAVAAKAPREAEVQDSGRLLGRRLAEWVAVVASGRKDQHPLAKPESRTLPG